MGFKTDHLPKDVEGWKAELIQRIKLSSGYDGPLGPNIMEVLTLMAHTLDAYDQTYKQMIAEIKGDTGGT